MFSLQLFQLLRFATLFLISIVIARFIPDQSLIGYYELLLLLGNSFTFFWVQGIINAFLPVYYSSDENEKPRLIYSSFFWLSLLSLLIAVLLFGLLHFISSKHDLLNMPFAIFTLFNAPAFIIEYILLIKERKRGILVYGIISLSLQLLAIALPLYSGYPLQISLWCLSLVSLGKYCYLLSLLPSRSGGFYSFIHLFTHSLIVKRALPLALAALVGGSMQYVDSYVIRWFYDAKTFAIFQYGARELPFVLLIANAASNVFSGRISAAGRGESGKVRKWESGQINNEGFQATLSSLRSYSARLMHIMFPLTLLLLFFSHYLYGKLYTAAFIPSAIVFNIFLLLVIPRLIFPQTVLLGLQQNKITFRVSLIEWTLNLALNFILIYFIGITGVAYSTVLAYLLEKVILAYFLKRQGINFSDYVPVKTWMLYSIILLVAFIVYPLIP